MNAAFLLMTTAWCSVGQVPSAPPAAFTVRGGACCGYVDPFGCERFGGRLRSHLRSLFAIDTNNYQAQLRRESLRFQFCSSPDNNAANRRESLRFQFCSSPDNNAENRRESLRFQFCSSPDNNAENRRESLRFQFCSSPDNNAEQLRESRRFMFGSGSGQHEQRPQEIPCAYRHERAAEADRAPSYLPQFSGRAE